MCFLQLHRLFSKFVLNNSLVDPSVESCRRWLPQDVVTVKSTTKKKQPSHWMVDESSSNFCAPKLIFHLALHHASLSTSRCCHDHTATDCQQVAPNIYLQFCRLLGPYTRFHQRNLRYFGGRSSCIKNGNRCRFSFILDATLHHHSLCIHHHHHYPWIIVSLSYFTKHC